MQELENLAQKVLEKRITVEDAIRKLLDFIYRNKTWFGLNRLDEDELHDFLLDQYHVFNRLFNNYDSSRGNFTCYLFGNILQAYQGWKRTKARSMLKNRTLEEIECLRVKTEEYGDFPDGSLYVSDSPLIQELPVEDLRRIISYQKRSGLRSEEGGKNRAIDSFRQSAVLVLMVKSWYLIDLILLEKISLVTEIQVESLIEILDKTRRIMEKKGDKLNYVRQSRNQSYYYMERCKVIGNLHYGMKLSQIINRKQDFHSQKWKKFNSMIKDQNRRLVPSNRIVGQILGMDQRRVQYILDKANKNMDILSLYCYYRRHEDLLGQRKFE